MKHEIDLSKYEMRTDLVIESIKQDSKIIDKYKENR